MSPECVILIARLCLPLASQNIVVSDGPFGAGARTQVLGVVVSTELWSDALDNRPYVLRYCKADACIAYTPVRPVRPVAENRYSISYEDEGQRRSLLVLAPDQKTLGRALDQLKVTLDGPSTHVLVPLSTLRVFENH